ncbi:TagK domain-containing protein [Atlantibacter sp. RC6]|uniref:TagK domain-containing protein n=1 Tax=Atlantibacter sp. RC6 TaxID=2587036 RepID=UPI001605B8EB|nr:TagK domain-containing protein [Atlantibacter sp. RC6]MBB3324697.1 hypothetical protein [Atlantibacter sp. RC6]
MRLSITWPLARQGFLLHEEYNDQACIRLDPLTGNFEPASVESDSEGALFYWSTSGPVILNHCAEYVCILDGRPLSLGETRHLLSGSKLQIGHVSIVIQLDREQLADALYVQPHSDVHPPEPGDIEDLLSYGGHHIAWQESAAAQSYLQEQQDDVLQKLQIEYKKRLIWGEQELEAIDKNSSSLRNKPLTEDGQFEQTKEKMKNRTLTECIFESITLFDKAFDEVMILGTEQDELFEENKYDILHLVAPDNIPVRKTRTIPDLIAREFHKRDLDSLL